jgi:Na+/H+-translocating membrane pyrophosphatase
MLAWWLLALIAAASISYMEHRTVLRHRATKPVSIWLASILIVANNTVFTSIYVRGLQATQLASNNLFINEVATTVVLGVWLSILIITLADTWESWRTTRNQLIEQKIQTILLTQSQIDLSNALEQNIRGELQDLMQKSNDDLAASIGDRDTESLIQHTKQILNAVEHLSQQVVQPFSQSL